MLKVLSPGICSLLVDHGRPRTRSLGVPLGGPADRCSLMVGNALVGNPPETTALEISLSGPTLEATCPLACVVYGAPFALHSDRRLLRIGKTFTLDTGEVLNIGGTEAGMRAYLCVRGGFLAPEVLGSRSALRPLQAGDVLACRPGVIGARFLRGEPRPGFARPGRRCAFWLEARPAGFPGRRSRASAHQISADSNRMGLRLLGTQLAFEPREMVSEPVCPGTVQVTRDGQCIVLGVDGQTIGGYPRIAHVIRADLDRLGQLRPGETVLFQQVSLGEAERLHQEQRAELQRWLAWLRHADSFVIHRPELFAVFPSSPLEHC